MIKKINNAFGKILKKPHNNIKIEKPLYPSGNQYYFKSNDDIIKYLIYGKYLILIILKILTYLGLYLFINSRNEKALKQFFKKS